MYLATFGVFASRHVWDYITFILCRRLWIHYDRMITANNQWRVELQLRPRAKSCRADKSDADFL